jgi:hypothetical protein
MGKGGGEGWGGEWGERGGDEGGGVIGDGRAAIDLIQSRGHAYLSH